MRWLTVILVFGASAQAQPRSLQVSLADCPATTEVQTLLAQLATELVDMNARLEREGAAGTLVIDTCDPQALSITMVRGERALHARLPMSPPSRERPRIMALAIAELVRTRWAELTPAPIPVDPPDSALQGELDRANERARATEQRLSETQSRLTLLETPTPARGARSRLEAGFAASIFAAGRLALGGPRLAVDVAVGDLRLVVDAMASFVRSDGNLGSATFAHVVGGLGVLWEARIESISVAVGGGVRLGIVHAEGQPFDPTRVLGHSSDSFAWTAGARAALRVPIIDRVGLGLDVEAGWGEGTEARAGDEIIAATSGPLVIVGATAFAEL